MQALERDIVQSNPNIHWYVWFVCGPYKTISVVGLKGRHCRTEGGQEVAGRGSGAAIVDARVLQGHQETMAGESCGWVWSRAAGSVCAHREC